MDTNGIYLRKNIESREHVDDETEMGCVNVSQLNLVDLAGSERAGQTGAKGVRFLEGTHINKSLSTLALVIRQLSEEPKKYVSYRDSKLTRILQNSLGGNARTCIVCAVAPSTVEETISTLKFANRAKAIKNKPEVNAVTTSDAMLQNLTRQMCKLQSQLESKKNLEKDNVNLKKQLVALQQLIINGFNQRSTKNIDRVQKKQSQLRRATISALPFNEKHISVSPPASKPKFCTPLLKYNPACIENAQDLIVNQGPAKPTLSPVHEENPNTVTPPRKKTVNFVDEVIEIDSGDEENTSDIKVCSPVRDCYDSSKTPTCVLRKAVKQVERSLKEHIELTELEKMYSPKVAKKKKQRALSPGPASNREVFTSGDNILVSVSFKEQQRGRDEEKGARRQARLLRRQQGGAAPEPRPVAIIDLTPPEPTRSASPATITTLQGAQRGNLSAVDVIDAAPIQPIEKDKEKEENKENGEVTFKKLSKLNKDRKYRSSGRVSAGGSRHSRRSNSSSPARSPPGAHSPPARSPRRARA